MAYLAFWLILVGGKAALMYGVWRLAKGPREIALGSIHCKHILR
jgi:hypothetical protein